MSKVILKATILIHSLFIIVKPIEGTCDRWFKYEKATDGQTVGAIGIPSPPKGTTLRIQVKMTINAELTTNYVGQVRLRKSKLQSVSDVNGGRTLEYIVDFPLRDPIPLITEISFNNQNLCSAEPAEGDTLTTITVEHSLFPTGKMGPPIYGYDIPEFMKKGGGGGGGTPPDPPKSPKPSQPNLPTWTNFFYHTTWPTASSQFPGGIIYYQPVTFPEAPTPTKSTTEATSSIDPRSTQWLQPGPVTENPTSSSLVNPFFTNKDPEPANPSKPNQVSNGLDCGLSGDVDPNQHVPITRLIVKGEATKPGQWPWLAAIFIKKRDDLNFQCGGTLITARYVLSAAHCFKISSTKNIPLKSIRISLGRFRLSDEDESGAVILRVINYKLHEDYKNLGSADSDVAIVKLEEEVQYTQTIRPICMWWGPVELRNIVDQKGVVVGWGRDEFGHPYLEEPRMVQIPVVSQEVCHWSNEVFVRYTSNRTFCAGWKDGSGPCNGDSGGGLFIRDHNTNRYQLRGIVSTSLLDRITNTCDLNQYVIFVDVAKYLDWIQSHIT